jgi:hypothetical protein
MRRWLKPHRFIEPGFELPHRDIHDDSCGTVVNPQDTAEALVESENVSGA